MTDAVAEGDLLADADVLRLAERGGGVSGSSPSSSSSSSSSSSMSMSGRKSPSSLALALELDDIMALVDDLVAGLDGSAAVGFRGLLWCGI